MAACAPGAADCCFADFGSPTPCCGQGGTAGACCEHTCSSAAPKCTGYVFNEHFGVCSAAVTPGGGGGGAGGGSEWGWDVLLVLLVGCLSYVTVGAFFGKGWTSGTSLGQKRLLGVRSHPHFDGWRGLKWLVADGVDFTTAQIAARTGGGGGAYEAVGAAAVADKVPAVAGAVDGTDSD